MFDKLMAQMQEQTETAKKKLDTILVTAQAEKGLVKATATGNKKITNIEISDEIANDKETIEDLVIIAVNKVLVEADAVYEKEMGGIAQDMIGGAGAMDGLGDIFGKK